MSQCVFCFVFFFVFFHFFWRRSTMVAYIFTQTHPPHITIKKLPMTLLSSMIFPIFCTLLKYLIILSMIFPIFLTPANHARLYFYSDPRLTSPLNNLLWPCYLLWFFQNFVHYYLFHFFLLNIYRYTVLYFLWCMLAILSLLSNFLFWSSTFLLFVSVSTSGIFICCDCSVFNCLWFLI